MASFTERYHELTKYNPNTIDRLGKVDWQSQTSPFKEISGQDLVPLASPFRIEEEDKNAPPAILEPGKLPNDSASVSALLFFTMGITAKLETTQGEFFLRTAPSAGGLYPTEIYVAIRKSKDIPDGVYHYHSRKSALVPVWKGDFWGDLRHHFLNQPQIEECDFFLLFTGIFQRSSWRYKERAYRRILLDTGHTAANLMEYCAHRNWRAVQFGGFLDDGLEELLFLTKNEEIPLLGVAIQAFPKSMQPVPQFPGPQPKEAIQKIDSKLPMQVQQNQAERIIEAGGLVPVEPPIETLMPASQPPIDVLKAIAMRRSCREFKSEPVSLEHIRTLFAYGYRGGMDWQLATGFLKSYVISLKVNGLSPGIYKLEQTSLELQRVRAGDFQVETYNMCLGQELASDCSMILVHTVELSSLIATYGERGYRYVCLDAGQIGERINLMAVQLGLGSSGIGGYFDDMVNLILDLPLSQAVIYITVIGVPA